MFAAYWRLIRSNRNYRLLWIAQVVSELGDWFYTLSVYSLLLDLTGSKAQSVALAVVVQVLPQTLVAPTVGVVNDLASRKAVMIAADVARFLIVLGMLVVQTPSLVGLVYVLLLFETVAAAFFEPAHSAVIPNIVPPEEALKGNTLSSITWSCCLAVGAALGGVTEVLAGRNTVFVLNAASFLVSAWLIRRMSFTEPHLKGRPPFRTRALFDFRPVLDGFRYIRGDARLFATVFVKFGIGLLGANNVLLPMLGERVFPVTAAGTGTGQGGMLGMSLLMGARGAGSLLGPLAGDWLAAERHRRLRVGILVGFLLAAAGYVWLGVAGSLAVAVATVALAHAGSSTNWVFSTTLLQCYTDDRFRGRVFAADVGLCTLGISASSYAAGAAIDMGIPARTIAVALGLVMLLPAAAWALALKATHSHRPAEK